MRRAVAAGALLLAAYVGLSFLNSERGFLGTDTGGKVATLKVMAERGRFDPDLGYWAEEFDPTGSLHPIAFTSHTASGKWVNVTTLPALWVGWLLYRVGGYRAALLVPMAGSVAACFAGLALFRRMGVGESWAWKGFWLLGLASPLTIYALDFWEHSLGVALMAWAVVLLVDLLADRGRWWHAAAAGGLFGVAATMRTESLVYLGVAVIAVVFAFCVRFGGPTAPKRTQIVRRWVSGGIVGALLLLGALVPLTVNEAVERRVVGSTVRASRVAGTALGVGDDPRGRLEEAATTLVGLEGTPAGLALGALFAALLALAARRRDTGVALMAVAGAGALLLVRAASSGLGFVPGLGPAWVLPVASAAATRATFGRAAFDRPNSARQDSRRLVLTIALAAVPVVLATQLRGGAGPQWAGRYLLVSGLLLAVLGWTALERRPRPVAAAFAALAVATTVFGLAWTSVRTHDVARTIAALEGRSEPVIVSSVTHLAREGGATYGDKRWLTLSSTAGPSAATAVLAQAGIEQFVAVAEVGDRPLRFQGFTAAGPADLRLFEGVGLRVTRWMKDP